VVGLALRASPTSTCLLCHDLSLSDDSGFEHRGRQSITQIRCCRGGTPEQAAQASLDLLLAPQVNPSHYGELVRFGRVLPWHQEIAPEAAAGVRVRPA